MTSQRIEDQHTKDIEQLMADSNLECIRPHTPDEEELTLETETEILPEEIPEDVHEDTGVVEEHVPVIEDVVPPAPPQVFPSPSLRRVIPRYKRKIEEDNRIHVLPAKFNKNIDPEMIPKIKTTPPQKYIDTLASIVGCHSYDSNLPEYWFLDTLANLLRRAQEDNLSRETQAVLIHWFCEWMKEMEYFDAADRPRMLRRFQENMLNAARYVSTENIMPTPDDIGVSYKAEKDVDHVGSNEQTHEVRKPDQTAADLPLATENSPYECSLIDLVRITHYIFDLFSTDFQYDLVRAIFTHGPDYIHINAPYVLNRPKKLYSLVKGKPKAGKGPKKEKPVTVKKGGTPSDQPPQAYLDMLELKAREEKLIEEEEEKEREEWSMRDSILPLSFAPTEELYDSYWPPTGPTPISTIGDTPKTAKGKK